MHFLYIRYCMIDNEMTKSIKKNFDNPNLCYLIKKMLSFSLVKSFSIFNKNTLPLLLPRQTCFIAIRSFSNTNAFNDKEREEKNKIAQKDVISPTLYAFAARMHLNFSDPKILLQVVTHKSFTDSN